MGVSIRRSGSTNTFYLMVGVALARTGRADLASGWAESSSAQGIRTNDRRGVGRAALLLCGGYAAANRGDRHPVRRRIRRSRSRPVRRFSDSPQSTRCERYGDLYLAADDGYTDLAYDKGLVEERIPVAAMRPVLAVKQGNPKASVHQDLLRNDVRVALGNPDQLPLARKLASSCKKQDCGRRSKNK